jgi:hypothetical protein
MSDLDPGKALRIYLQRMEGGFSGFEKPVGLGVPDEQVFGAYRMALRWIAYAIGRLIEEQSRDLWGAAGGIRTDPGGRGKGRVIPAFLRLKRRGSFCDAGVAGSRRHGAGRFPCPPLPSCPNSSLNPRALHFQIAEEPLNSRGGIRMTEATLGHGKPPWTQGLRIHGI